MPERKISMIMTESGNFQVSLIIVPPGLNTFLY